MANNSHVDILLIDDNLGDIRLISDALEDTDVKPGIRYVRDGVEALQFLHREAPFEGAPRPRIIILDLNLPRKDGRVTLKEIKSDAALSATPVIIFSVSDAPQDIATCYALGANCYLVKPRDLYSLTETVHSLVDFWLRRVKLPSDLDLEFRREAVK